MICHGNYDDGQQQWIRIHRLLLLFCMITAKMHISATSTSLSTTANATPTLPHVMHIQVHTRWSRRHRFLPQEVDPSFHYENETMEVSPVTVSSVKEEEETEKVTGSFNLSQTLSVIIYQDVDNIRDELSQQLYKFDRIRGIEQQYSDGSSRFSWIGTVVPENAGDIYNGFATLVQMPNGQLVGMFTTEYDSHTLTTLPDGTMQMQSYMWENVPKEIQMGRAVQTGQGNDANGSKSAIDNEDSFVSESSTQQPLVSVPSTTIIEDSKASDVIQGPIDPQRHRTLRRVQTIDVVRENTTIDLLVIVTNRAMCEAANKTAGCPYNDDNAAAMLSLLAVAEAQTNAAMQMVGVAVEIRWVQIIFLVAESGDLFGNENSLAKIASSSTVQKWRDDYGADLVAAIGTLDPVTPYCGMAYMLDAFSITALHPYCFNIFTITHEIGHNLNANHDRFNTPPFPLHPYAHGLQVPGILRTVMAYPCNVPDTLCAAVPLFSAAGYTYNSIPIGDATVDNARMIREMAGKVSMWKGCKVSCYDSNETEVIKNTEGAIDSGSNGIGGGKSGGCFSSANIVSVLGKGEIKIDKLHIGDFVDVGMGRYSQVYSFSHIDHESEAEFLQIHTNGSEIPLELTRDHVLFVAGKVVRGSDVRVGDMLGDHKVLTIQVIRRRGVYAPVTFSGILVVSGIMVSSYVAILDLPKAAIQHWVSHEVLWLHRAVCILNADFCLSETYTDGISNAIYSTASLVENLNKLSIWIQAALWILAFPAFSLFYAFQSLCWAFSHGFLYMLSSFLLLFPQKSAIAKVKAKLFVEWKSFLV